MERDLQDSKLKISAEGYRKIVKKHKQILKSYDARITDESKLALANMAYLQRMRLEMQDYVEYDESLNKRVENQPNPHHLGEWDDECILAESDPYLALLYLVEAIIESHFEPENQQGICEYRQRFGGALTAVPSTESHIKVHGKVHTKR
ncbi:MAG: hypothetical protein FWE27_07755 [Defluviitaleaceae bacterium]|nr:hypothetical protein [Defluviitaleaceae bacterium]